MGGVDDDDGDGVGDDVSRPFRRQTYLLVIYLVTVFAFSFGMRSGSMSYDVFAGIRARCFCMCARLFIVYWSLNSHKPKTT